MQANNKINNENPSIDTEITAIAAQKDKALTRLKVAAPIMLFTICASIQETAGVSSPAALNILADIVVGTSSMVLGNGLGTFLRARADLKKLQNIKSQTENLSR